MSGRSRENVRDHRRIADSEAAACEPHSKRSLDQYPRGRRPHHHGTGAHDRPVHRGRASGVLGRTALVLAFLAASVIALAVGNLNGSFSGSCYSTSRFGGTELVLRLSSGVAWRDRGLLGIGYHRGTCGLYTLWAIDRNRSIEGPLRLWPALPLAAYVGATALSLVTAADRGLGVFQLTLLLQALLVFVYVSNALRTRKDIVFAVAVLVVGFLVEGMIMLGMAVADLQFDFAGLGTRTNELAGDAEVSRLGGTIRSANGAAAYVAMMIPITMSVLWADVPVWVKRVGYVALPVGAVALILTYSRGGWAAALAGVTVLMLIGVRSALRLESRCA